MWAKFLLRILARVELEEELHAVIPFMFQRRKSSVFCLSRRDTRRKTGAELGLNWRIVAMSAAGTPGKDRWGPAMIPGCWIWATAVELGLEPDVGVDEEDISTSVFNFFKTRI